MEHAKQFVEHFCRMDSIFQAVLIKWDASNIPRPTFRQVSRQECEEFDMGFMSTFHFEARDRIAMAEVTKRSELWQRCRLGLDSLHASTVLSEHPGKAPSKSNKHRHA
jgi:hypothetical protein